MAFGGESWAAGVWDTLTSLADAAAASFAAGGTRYVSLLGSSHAAYSGIRDYMGTLHNAMVDRGYSCSVGAAPEPDETNWTVTLTKVA